MAEVRSPIHPLPPVILFDAYGTLFDIHSSITRAAQGLGDQSQAFSMLWRNKQLEYSWTLSLAEQYQDFWTITEQALDFAMARHELEDIRFRKHMLETYLHLNVYPDVVNCLSALRKRGRRMAIFTNGTHKMVEALVKRARLEPYFEAIISVDEIKKFKTHPDAYRHALSVMKTVPEETALVSSNRWDIMGAHAAQIDGYWLNRGKIPDEYKAYPAKRRFYHLSEMAW